jgi:hypothetical protein
MILNLHAEAVRRAWRATRSAVARGITRLSARAGQLNLAVRHHWVAHCLKGSAMLALKLHKKSIPWLGSGSHLLPVITWDAANLQLRKWRKLLTAAKGRTTPWPNTQINFVTLAQIPDNHPVRFRFASGPSNFVKESWYDAGDCRPLQEYPDALKRYLAEWWDAYNRESRKVVDKNGMPVRFGGLEVVIQGRFETGGLLADAPELILGKALPKACAKWTKDLRLLYGRKTPRRRLDARSEEA